MNNAQVMLGHMATAAYYISSLDCGGACAAATCVRQAAAADGQSSTTTMTTWAAAKVKATSPHRRPKYLQGISKCPI